MKIEYIVSMKKEMIGLLIDFCIYIYYMIYLI